MSQLCFKEYHLSTLENRYWHTLTENSLWRATGTMESRARHGMQAGGLTRNFKFFITFVLDYQMITNLDGSQGFEIFTEIHQPFSEICVQKKML